MPKILNFAHPSTPPPAPLFYPIVPRSFHCHPAQARLTCMSCMLRARPIVFSVEFATLTRDGKKTKFTVLSAEDVTQLLKEVGTRADYSVPRYMLLRLHVSRTHSRCCCRRHSRHRVRRSARLRRRPRSRRRRRRRANGRPQNRLHGSRLRHCTAGQEYTMAAHQA